MDRKPELAFEVELDSSSAIGGLHGITGLAKIDVDTLKKNLGETLDGLSVWLSAVGDNIDFEIDEISLNIKVNSKGDVSIGVASGQIGGNVGINLKLKRKVK